MKTPRELLLARHKAAEPKLDGIRRSALKEAFGLRREAERHAAFALESQVPKAVSSLRFATAIQILWRELIWPCRRTWAGLAVAWIAIAVFNLSHPGNQQTIMAKSSTPPADMRLVMQEQRRVLAEIIGPGFSQSPAEPPRRPSNQPRSQLRSVAMA